MRYLLPNPESHYARLRSRQVNPILEQLRVVSDIRPLLYKASCTWNQNTVCKGVQRPYVRSPVGVSQATREREESVFQLE